MSKHDYTGAGGVEKTGKTRFNRGKPRGESWVKRRDLAIKTGAWIMPKQNKQGEGSSYTIVK